LRPQDSFLVKINQTNCSPIRTNIRKFSSTVKDAYNMGAAAVGRPFTLAQSREITEIRKPWLAHELGMATVL
jgi:DhnA family fructose-bisphosphate aldolase class Ia